MAEVGGQGGWELLGASALGSSHVRTATANQDSIGWRKGEGGGAVLVAADGHGGVRYTRSGEGSRMAVEVTLSATMGFLAAHVDDAGPDLAAAIGEELVPAIVHDWARAVREHQREHPLPEGAHDDLEPYGSTVIGALVGRRAVGLFQIGDGDIVAVGPDGRAARPLPPDARLVGNATTSLCLPTAVTDARVGWLPADTAELAVLWLSTDGYSNSFGDDSGFLAVGADLVQRLAEGGIGDVEEQLPGWLAESARIGGDDTSLVAAVALGPDGRPAARFVPRPPPVERVGVSAAPTLPSPAPVAPSPPVAGATPATATAPAPALTLADSPSVGAVPAPPRRSIGGLGTRAQAVLAAAVVLVVGLLAQTAAITLRSRSGPAASAPPATTDSNNRSVTTTTVAPTTSVDTVKLITDIGTVTVFTSGPRATLSTGHSGQPQTVVSVGSWTARITRGTVEISQFPGASPMKVQRVSDVSDLAAQPGQLYAAAKTGREVYLIDPDRAVLVTTIRVGTDPDSSAPGNVPSHSGGAGDSTTRSTTG